MGRRREREVEGRVSDKVISKEGWAMDHGKMRGWQVEGWGGARDTSKSE